MFDKVTITPENKARQDLALEKIKAIMEEYDMPGMVVLHVPGNTDFFWKVDSKHTALKFEFSPNDPHSVVGIRIRAKAAEFEGGAAERNYVLAATDNFLSHMNRVLTDRLRDFRSVYSLFTDKTGGFDTIEK